MQCLNEEDRKLNQIKDLLPLLLNGIGIHHSGLLPIMKEIVEILFQEGFIKCLFATETFSMGLNMPARTVVFTNVKKFDGKQTRYLRPGEYIQMSGRAGRRGKDDQGTVILMVDQKIEPTVLKNMIFGKLLLANLMNRMMINLNRTSNDKVMNLLIQKFSRLYMHAT